MQGEEDLYLPSHVDGYDILVASRRFATDTSPGVFSIVHNRPASYGGIEHRGRGPVPVTHKPI